MYYKRIVPSSQKTKRLSITKFSQLMLFGEMITLYYENHKKHTNTLCGQNAEDFNVIALDL
jgi:hypothetical protein